MKTRVIKKYSNRKLYDLETSSYITLGQFKSLYLEDKKSVKVYLNDKDITHLTFLSSLVAEEKERLEVEG